MFFLSPAYAKKNKKNSREIEPQVEKGKSIKKLLNDWINVKIITPVYEGDRRIEGHYEERLVPSGHWQEYEEKTWISGHYE